MPGTARPGSSSRSAAPATATRPEPLHRTALAAPREPGRPHLPHPGFRVRRGRIDIDVHRAEVRHLLRSIARATETNIVLFAGVQGAVTVQLRNQPLRSAVEVVARAVGCSVHPSGRMLIVRCP